MSGQGRCGISCLRLGLLGRYNGQSSVEAHKLFAGTCVEGARDGPTVAELMSLGAALLGAKVISGSGNDH